MSADPITPFEFSDEERSLLHEAFSLCTPEGQSVVSVTALLIALKECEQITQQQQQQQHNNNSANNGSRSPIFTSLYQIIDLSCPDKTFEMTFTDLLDILQNYLSSVRHQYTNDSFLKIFSILSQGQDVITVTTLKSAANVFGDNITIQNMISMLNIIQRTPDSLPQLNNDGSEQQQGPMASIGFQEFLAIMQNRR